MVSDAPYDQLLRSTIGAMCYADELGYDISGVLYTGHGS